MGEIQDAYTKKFDHTTIYGKHYKFLNDIVNIGIFKSVTIIKINYKR